MGKEGEISTTTNKGTDDHPTKGKSEEDDGASLLHSFLTSTSTIVVTIIRIGHCILPKEWLFSANSVIGWLLHSPEMAPFWTSTLIRPYETWHHIAEAKAIRHLFSDQQFRNAYRGSAIHVPPLVLAALEPLLNLFPASVIGMMTHLVDLAIALQLLQLGKFVLSNELRDPWEDEIQPKIPQSLRPTLTHVFPISDKQVEYTDELPPKKEIESKDDDNSKQEEEEDSPENDDNSQNDIQEEDTTTIKEEEITEEDEPGPPAFTWSDLPVLAAQIYYYSPFTALASGLGTTHHSFQNLWLLLLLLSFNKVCSSPSVVPLSTFFLALASYSELHYFIYLIPLTIWFQRRAETLGKIISVETIWFYYGFWCSCLQGLTLLLVGETQYSAIMYSSFGYTFKWKSLPPNFSVLWYMNMELFERYRTYFAILIGGLPYLLVIPLTIRLYRYPMVLTAIFWMLWMLIRPTSTLVDANIAACLAVLCPRSLVRMRTATSLIPAFAIMVPICLYLVTLWMWLESGAGEANFTFFQCLAYCAFLSTICLEFCGASIRRDKVLRLTSKLLLFQQQQQQQKSDDDDDNNNNNNEEGEPQAQVVVDDDPVIDPAESKRFSVLTGKSSWA